MSYIAETLRKHSVEIVRLHRQDAMRRLPGKVTMRDPQSRKVRLQIGSDPETGAAILSPWVRIQSLSAGAFKVFVLPSVGEPMYLESSSGKIGGDSLATFGAFDDENPHPQQEADEMVIENGDTRIALKNGRVLITAAGRSIQLDGSGLKVLADIESIGTIKNNGKPIDSTHVHIGVMPGAGQSGAPK